MYLQAFVGKTVFLNLTQAFIEANPAFVQDHGQRVYARLRAVDGMGLWVENSKWKTTPGGGEQETHRLVFQVPFSALLSVGAFPERNFTDERREEESCGAAIGFLVGKDS